MVEEIGQGGRMLKKFPLVANMGKSVMCPINFEEGVTISEHCFCCKDYIVDEY